MGDAQSLANTAWAYGATERMLVSAIRALARRRSPRASPWTACELSSAAWAFSRFGHGRVAAAGVEAKWCDAQLAEVVLLDIANPAWAYESLDVPAQREIPRLVSATDFDIFVENAMRDVRAHGIELVHFANA